MIQQTSLLAYDQLDPEQLNDRYKEIMEAVKAMRYGATDREIARYCGYLDPNKIRPRRNELVSRGWLEKVGKRPCRITRKVAIMWQVVGKRPTLLMENLKGNKRGV